MSGCFGNGHLAAAPLPVMQSSP